MNQRFKNLFKFNIRRKFNLLVLLFFLIIKFFIWGEKIFFFLSSVDTFSHNRFSQDLLKPLNTYYSVKIDTISSGFLFFFF